MRIIAGEARGRRIEAPRGTDTRPVLDQLKARTFDVLGPIPAGALVWDLFAGAGSFGLEALSRGAGRCLFVELGAEAAGVIGRNLATLGFGARGAVRRADALAWRPAAGETPPDLVFCDPPFPLVERAPADIAALVTRLDAALAPGGALVYRTPARARLPGPLPFEDRLDAREHGVNLLHVVRARA